MVAGLMNSSENDPVVYDYIDFVAYDIINKPMDKVEQIRTLNTLGFLTPVHEVLPGVTLNDTELTEMLEELRTNSLYEIDGVVLDVNSVETRRELIPSRETLNPSWAIKYKVADASNAAIAEVIGVKWNVSKHGYLKPVIWIKPVELVGVTVSKCTGFNAKFIYENKIGPGAKINITRSGDVIPFCTGVVSPMPVERMT
jgi:NAD-dependent DNA ligase